MTIQEAYEILKANARYSSGDCEGFVYLSQIRELITNEETFKLPTNQAETVQFLLMNASRLDDEHFNSLMAKLEQWKDGRTRIKASEFIIK